MMHLKKLGFFKELTYEDDDGGSLELNITEKPIDSLTNLLSYLQNQAILAISPMISVDVLSDEKKEIGFLMMK